MRSVAAATAVVPLLALSLVAACATRSPAGLGVTGSRLAPCPSSPNCVSSDASAASQRVEPFRLSAPPANAWRAAVDAVARLPRTRVVVATDEYLHAECRSLVFRFVDDLELHLRAADAIISVRSASRVGHSDLGVNRRRIERLRAALVERGVVAAK